MSNRITGSLWFPLLAGCLIAVIVCYPFFAYVDRQLDLIPKSPRPRTGHFGGDPTGLADLVQIIVGVMFWFLSCLFHALIVASGSTRRLQDFVGGVGVGAGVVLGMHLYYRSLPNLELAGPPNLGALLVVSIVASAVAVYGLSATIRGFRRPTKGASTEQAVSN